MVQVIQNWWLSCRTLENQTPLENRADTYHSNCEHVWYSSPHWGWFLKSWVQGGNHRDSSIHLCPTPTPNFLRSYFVAQKFGVERKKAYEIDPWSNLNKFVQLVWLSFVMIQLTEKWSPRKVFSKDWLWPLSGPSPTTGSGRQITNRQISKVFFRRCRGKMTE